MNYGFTVFQTKVDNHIFWMAESKDLKGCVGQGETVDEALRELESNEREWMKTAIEEGIIIPEPSLETINAYSGKFVVRVSPLVHKEASEQARKQGISLNQYINNAIVTMNGAFVTADAIKNIVKEIRNQSLSESQKYRDDNVIPFK